MDIIVTDFLIAKQDTNSKILGFISVSFRFHFGFIVTRLITVKPSFAEIYNIGVKKSFRNIGAGKKLITELFRRLAVNKIDDISFEGKITNNLAIDFYENIDL